MTDLGGALFPGSFGCCRVISQKRHLTRSRSYTPVIPVKERREPGPIPEGWWLATGADSRSLPEWVPDIAARFRDDGAWRGFEPIFCTFRERSHGHPRLAVIPAKERSDASRDPFWNAGGWERVRTHALCRNGSRIGFAVRDDGAGRDGGDRKWRRGVSDGDRAQTGGGGVGAFGAGMKGKLGCCH
jgi:hypothetical protein